MDIDTLDLNGQVVIVTDGATDIGCVISYKAALKGAHVIVVDVDHARINGALSKIRGISGVNEPLGIKVDICNEDSLKEMVRQVVDKYSRIDSLVTCVEKHNTIKISSPVVSLTLKEWEEIIEYNLKRIFLFNRFVLPVMIKQKKGCIINMSSSLGLRGKANFAAYCAAHRGIIGFSGSLAEEVRRLGIKVQVALPELLTDRTLAESPEQILHIQAVANFIVYMLCLPADAVLVNPVIAHFSY